MNPSIVQTESFGQISIIYLKAEKTHFFVEMSFFQPPTHGRLYVHFGKSISYLHSFTTPYQAYMSCIRILFYIDPIDNYIPWGGPWSLHVHQKALLRTSFQVTGIAVVFVRSSPRGVLKLKFIYIYPICPTKYTFTYVYIYIYTHL